MYYKESIKKFSLLIESLEDSNDLSEAVVGKQRANVLKTREDYKKADMKLLSKRANIIKNIHLMSPAEKEQAKKAMGFSAKKKAKKKTRFGNIIFGSEIDPDTLYREARYNGSEGYTFIYDINNNKIYTTYATKVHSKIVYDIIGKDDDDMFLDPKVIFGRWVDVIENNGNIKKGKHVAFWNRPPNDKYFDIIINKLNITPDFIHSSKNRESYG